MTIERQSPKEYLEGLTKQKKTISILTEVKKRFDLFCLARPDIKKLYFASKALDDAMEKEIHKDDKNDKL